MTSPSPAIVEIAWLAMFLVAFVLLVVIMNLTVVRHGFNAKIAIVLAGVLAAVFYTVVRGATRRR